MANASIEIEIRALDNASRAFDNIERSLGPISRRVRSLEGQFDGVDRSINRTSGSFGRLRGLLAGAITIGGITAFTNSVIEASSRAEDLKTTLETVTGSAQAGDEAFRFINDFATRTPFDIETLTETFIKLRAAGIEPTEELLTTFGDMAAVTTDKVGSLAAITDLFSRTTAGGLGLEDLNRLADRGIPVFDILNEKLGVTRLEVSELGKTAEGAEQIRQALVEGLNEGFGGGMERASQNLSTSLSNLGIAANNALIKVGEGGLSDAINNATLKMTSFITENEDLALALGEKLGQAVTMAVDGFGFIIEKLQQAEPIFNLIGMILTDIVGPALGFLFDMAVKVAEALGPIVEELIPVGAQVFENLGIILTDYVVPAFETIIEVAGRVIEFVGGMITNVVEGIQAIGDFVDAGKDLASAGLNRAGEAIGGAVDTVTDFGSGVADSIGDGMSAAGNFVSNGVDNILNSLWYMEDEAVANSIVPDMVESIGDWMSRLQEILSNPVAIGVDQSLASMNMMADAAIHLGHVMETVGDKASVMTDRMSAMAAVSSDIVTPSFQRMSEMSSSAINTTFSANDPLHQLNLMADRGMPVFDDLYNQLGMTRLEIAEFMRTQEGRVQVSNALIAANENRFNTPPELNSNTNFNISGVTVNNGDRLNSPEATRYIEGIATRIAYNVLRQNTRFGGF